MYTLKNFKTKKALKEAVQSGEFVGYFQPNAIPGYLAKVNGEITVEGPHYPEPHRWYAVCKVQNGRIVSVK